MTRICILGGGFGGLYTALELSRRPWPDPPEITLVDRDERFVFLPLLYELLSEEMEEWEVAPRFQELLAPDPKAESLPIRFQQAEVQAIDLDAKRIRLSNDATLDYDCLVLSLGGDTPLHRVPGAADFALPFRHLPDVTRLRAAMQTWKAKAPDQPIRIAIAGAGASGVELACKLADQLGSRARIRLIEMGSEILPGFLPSSREAALAALAERQVQIELNTQVVAIQAESIQVKSRLGSDDPICSDPVDGVIWTAGTQVAAAIQPLPLPKDEGQRLVVNAQLQVEGHPEIFAIGDLAAVTDPAGNRIPASAQAAFQQAGYCAWNVWAWTTQDRPLLPFRYQVLGEMLSLGVDSAVLTSLGLTLKGPLGYLARRGAYLVRMPTLEHQMRVGWNWVTRPILQEVQKIFKPA